MKVILGSDHAGFELKQEVKSYLQKEFKEIEIVDVGCESKNVVDYPDYAQKMCELLQNDINQQFQSVGIAICGSGVGISIVCNKHPNIKCGLAFDLITTQNEINQYCNVLALGERVISYQLALKIVQSFVSFKLQNQI